jgi:hypothetical protein
MVKATSATFTTLADRFGGNHARHAVVHYLSRDVASLLNGQYTDGAGH